MDDKLSNELRDMVVTRAGTLRARVYPEDWWYLVSRLSNYVRTHHRDGEPDRIHEVVDHLLREQGF